MRIKTRNNLIEYLEENASGRYLRALQNYNENLGAFSQVLDYNTPGWIVKVTSKHGNVYHIAVIIQSPIQRFMLAILYKDPPWKYWIGDQSKNQLYQGDNPKKYKELRNAKTKNFRFNSITENSRSFI